mgnify:CR=1 FL=1
MKQFVITLLAVLGVLAVAVYCQPVDETAMEAVSGALSPVPPTKSPAHQVLAAISIPPAVK